MQIAGRLVVRPNAVKDETKTCLPSLPADPQPALLQYSRRKQLLPLPAHRPELGRQQGPVGAGDGEVEAEVDVEGLDHRQRPQRTAAALGNAGQHSIEMGLIRCGGGLLWRIPGLAALR